MEMKKTRLYLRTPAALREFGVVEAPAAALKLYVPISSAKIKNIMRVNTFSGAFREHVFHYSHDDMLDGARIFVADEPFQIGKP